MDINNSIEINFKIILVGVILASLIHLIAIPLIELLPKKLFEEEEEPIIVLDLIKEPDKLQPIIEQKIIKPQIKDIIVKEQRVEEILPPTKATKIQKIEKKFSSPIPQNIIHNIENQIIIPLKPEQNNISKNFTTPVNPRIPKIITEEPLIPIIQKQYNTNSQTIINSPNKHKLSSETPILQENLPAAPPPQMVKENYKTDQETEKNYINSIRNSIQAYAIRNYPKRSLRLYEEGTVQIIFKLKVDGNLENIKIGPATIASERLINAAKKAVEQNAPYDSNEILQQKNEFSILIIYKIN